MIAIGPGILYTYTIISRMTGLPMERRFQMFDLSTLCQVVDIKSRSISPENYTGEPGKGGMCPPEQGIASHACRNLGMGWKVNPCVRIEGGSIFEMADIQGPGMIRHIWLTPQGRWRDLILRIYWDDQAHPSVECPVGDFFCMGWNEYSQISSMAVCVNPGSAFNCYWQMPFLTRCRITLENLADKETIVYYQVDYTLQTLPDTIAYFHAQFHRTNPLPYKEVYTIVDGIRGKGQYVGTYMAWGVNNSNWWGEGEIKFYMDGDRDYPTICGTGTEDYFCGSYNFEDPLTHDRYAAFSTPYTGLQVLAPDKLYRSQFRFGMYRWHIPDPIYFDSSLKVTIQALGWRSEGRYLPLQDDIASVAYWYQTLPTVEFPPLPDRDYLEII